jgi:predicted enzyme involved in methoxymalonyl-ACP biosynthesis
MQNTQSAKVKTFVMGTINGCRSTFEKLDKYVLALCKNKKRKIIKIDDTLYPGTIEDNGVAHIARRVIYTGPTYRGKS